jgi:hypothetical protein
VTSEESRIRPGLHRTGSGTVGWRGTLAWHLLQPTVRVALASCEFRLLSRGSRVRVTAGATSLIDGLAPLELPHTLARRGPVPRSARVVLSLRSFALSHA